jgi:cytochrome c peroxidase
MYCARPSLAATKSCRAPSGSSRIATLLALLCAACAPAGSDSGREYAWDLPEGFPEPAVPADNPLTISKVELGRYLFYDSRLSRSGTLACASCHAQARAFTSAQVHDRGATGSVLRHVAPSLVNVAYAPRLTWANPVLRELERQVQVPLFADRPVELGLPGTDVDLRVRLGGEPRYTELFAAAFPEDAQPLTALHVIQALACFERTLIAGDSDYDRGGAASASVQRGAALFFSETTHCAECHAGFAFSDYAFHNTGLYDVDGHGGYPKDDRGVIELTGDASDMGRFRTPTLRNVALTAPYMHDGSIATLAEVIDHYAAGGSVIDDGPARGDGRANPWKDERVSGFEITPSQREDLVHFLESLTDHTLLEDARFADPWQ